MHILLTNDDGIEAPGLAALAGRARRLGRITIVAPEREQSGVSHGFTLHRPITCRRLADDAGAARYAVDGTPADCIKLAVAELIDDPIDLVISGINPGANVGVSVFYSGTVAAALEAGMSGLPALAVSMGASYAVAEDLDFVRGAEIALGLIEDLWRRGLVGATPLNINLPPLEDGWPLGWRVARQSVAAYADGFESDGSRRDYRILRGETRRETDDDTDLALLARGYVTVTPLGFDLTHQPTLEVLRRVSGAGCRAEGSGFRIPDTRNPEPEIRSCRPDSRPPEPEPRSSEPQPGVLAHGIPGGTALSKANAPEAAAPAPLCEPLPGVLRRAAQALEEEA